MNLTNVAIFQIAYHKEVSLIMRIFGVPYPNETVLKQRPLICHIVLPVIFLTCSVEAYSQRIIRAGSEITHELVDEEGLKSRLEFLTDSICGGRESGSSGNVEAGMWIARQFRSQGMLPFGESYFRSFRAGNGAICRNVCGFLPAAGKAEGKRYMIVAAHYDGYGILDGNMYPGADSNASGVVAMLGVGKMVSAMMSYGKAYRQNIIFVALDAKNLNMAGAEELWKALKEGTLRDPQNGRAIRPSDISLMVNIDQVGSSLSPIREGREDYLILLTDGAQDFYRGSLKYASTRYSIPMDLGFDYYGSRSFTDMFYRRVSEQKVFLENGVNAVMFTSGITMNNNKTRDTVSTLDLSLLKRRIWLMFHWLERGI